MKWSKFEPLFHESWHPKVKSFIESEECDNIYNFLKRESARGKIIAPDSSKVFRCFKYTEYDNLNVVLCGMSPYHTMRNTKLVADGLLMGCSSTGYVQPSLANFYDAIERELHGLNVSYYKNPDVRYLAQQGVLMLNAALTTELHKAGNHASLWEPFMKHLFENAINITGVPIIFLGKDAAKLEKYTVPLYGTHIFKLSHPASASYSGMEWDSEGVFTKVNKILKLRNGVEIDWLNKS